MRSLSRLKVVLDELRSRAATSTTLGMPDPVLNAMNGDIGGARIMVVEDRAAAARQIAETLAARHLVDVESDPQEALFKGAEGDYDMFVVSLGLRGHDGLRLCSQLRSLERTRQVPILVVAEPEDRPRLLRGLDLGVNDYLLRPIDHNELIARARTQIRRKFYADRLRDNVQASIELAIVDTLTSLHNRRYFNTNFAALMDQAARRGRCLSLMILDIDHFKLVNDTHGHDAGDNILKTFAARIRNVIRAGDLICRLGGEEFAVLMPDTALDIGARIAERVRACIDGTPFALSIGQPPIPVPVSIGLAERGVDMDPEALMRRADAALYRSKGSGRNRVTADAA